MTGRWSAGGVKASVHGDPPFTAAERVGVAVGVPHAEGEAGEYPRAGAQQGRAAGGDLVAGCPYEGRAGDLRVLVEQVERGPYGVHADVPQGAAAELGAESDVLLGQGRDGELRIERAEFPDGAGRHELAYPRVLGVVDEHDVLHEHEPAGAGEGQETAGRGRVEGERLLREYVLARAEGRLRPVLVQGRGQRDVHGVDVVPGEEFPVPGNGPGPEGPGGRSGLLGVPAGDGGRHGLRQCGHRRQHAAPGDVGAAEDPDADGWGQREGPPVCSGPTGSREIAWRQAIRVRAWTLT